MLVQWQRIFAAQFGKRIQLSQSGILSLQVSGPHEWSSNPSSALAHGAVLPGGRGER
jgi:hypothetical protein